MKPLAYYKVLVRTGFDSSIQLARSNSQLAIRPACVGDGFAGPVGTGAEEVVGLAVGVPGIPIQ